MLTHRKGLLLLCMLLGILHFGLHAQHLNAPMQKGEYGIQLGMNQGYFKDLNFSPLNYTSPGYHFAFYLQKQNEKSYWRIALEADYTNLQSKVADYLETLYLMPQLQFSWLKKLNLGGDRLSLFVGPQLEGQINYMDWNGQDSFSYMFAYSLNAQAIADYQLSERQHISSALSVPLLTLLVRPPSQWF